MNQILKASATLALSLFLSACSSVANKSEFREQFLTQINADGSKWFSYSLKPTANLNHLISQHGRERLTAKNSSKKKSKSSQRSKKQQRPSNDTKSLNKKYTPLVDMYLFKTGYCRQGFIELARYQSEREFYLRAECKESANEADWKKWPNNGHFEAENLY